MPVILNFEAAQRTRDPRYLTKLEAVRACEELRDELVSEAPVSMITKALTAVEIAVVDVLRHAEPPET